MITMMQDTSNLSHFCTRQAHDKHMTSTCAGTYNSPHDQHTLTCVHKFSETTVLLFLFYQSSGRNKCSSHQYSYYNRAHFWCQVPLASLSAFTQQHKVHELVSKHSHKQTIYAHIRSVQSKRYRQGRHSTTCVIESHALPHSQLACYYFKPPYPWTNSPGGSRYKTMSTQGDKRASLNR